LACSWEVGGRLYAVSKGGVVVALDYPLQKTHKEKTQTENTDRKKQTENTDRKHRQKTQ